MRKFFKKMIGKVFSLASVFCALGFVSGCSRSENYSRDAVNSLGAAVYNSSVASSDDIEMVSPSAYELKGDEDTPWAYRNLTFFTSVKILDCFYFSATFESNLTPFFGQGFSDSPVNVVVALLGFYKKNGDIVDREPIIVLEKEGIVQGFLGTGIVLKDFSGDFSLSMVSFFFLTSNAIVKHYEKNDDIYDFDVTKKSGSVSLSVHHEYGIGTFIEEVGCSVSSDSYRALSPSDAEGLVTMSKVVTRTLDALVTGFSADMQTLSVSCATMQNLKNVAYMDIMVKGSPAADPFKALKIGSNIECVYFQRYIGYDPVMIRAEFVYVL